ncbi:hypothetical protein BV22DRAFT_1052008 [Leucogyrophana mollusca]|uniref:Uncharacterized protein n=1 Tax=Leucogyrophana mollusca TaxID=85980 RepID=A0ACB8AXD5_9AGAM|nr:hypothetical protein BV22DRAFT_1052008 [Leucogyrophana mollusca]
MRQSGYTQPLLSSSPKGHGSSEKKSDAPHKGHRRGARRITVRALLDRQGVATSRGHTIKPGHIAPNCPTKQWGQQQLFAAQVVKDSGGQENQLDADLEAHEVLKLPQSEAGEEPQDKASVKEPLEGPQYETDEELIVKAMSDYNNNNNNVVVYIWSMHDQIPEDDLMIDGEASGSLQVSSPSDSLPELEDTEGPPMGEPSDASSNRWFYHQATGVTHTLLPMHCPQAPSPRMSTQEGRHPRVVMEPQNTKQYTEPGVPGGTFRRIPILGEREESGPTGPRVLAMHESPAEEAREYRLFDLQSYQSSHLKTRCLFSWAAWAAARRYSTAPSWR